MIVVRLDPHPRHRSRHPLEPQPFRHGGCARRGRFTIADVEVDVQERRFIRPSHELPVSVRRLAVEHDCVVAQEAQAVQVLAGGGDPPQRRPREVKVLVDLRVEEEAHVGTVEEEQLSVPGEASRYRSPRDEVNVRKP